MLTRVVIESPYAGEVDRNVQYARACMRNSLDRGEAPIASHLLYTQVLDDDVEADRKLGIEVGLQWGAHADKAVFYVDLGWSNGMKLAHRRWQSLKMPIEIRHLHTDNQP